MKNIEQIATDMRRLAAEIGGEHHTSQESEKLLKDLADELSDMNMAFSLALHDLIDNDYEYTGITEDFRYAVRRRRGIERAEQEKEISERVKDGKICSLLLFGRACPYEVKNCDNCRVNSEDIKK